MLHKTLLTATLLTASITAQAAPAYLMAVWTIGDPNIAKVYGNFSKNYVEGSPASSDWVTPQWDYQDPSITVAYLAVDTVTDAEMVAGVRVITANTLDILANGYVYAGPIFMPAVPQNVDNLSISVEGGAVPQ